MSITPYRAPALTMLTPSQAVEAIYTAFSSGNVPAILEHLAPDVAWDSWENNFAQRAGVPWLLPRTGHAGAVEFFTVLGNMKFHAFAVLSIMANDRQAVAEVALDVELANGERVRDEELHLWTFGSDGKVTRFRHYVDTAKHIAGAKLG